MTPEARARTTAYERERRAKNPKAAIEAYRRWRAKNLDRVRAESRIRTRQWYAENREYALAQKKIKYATDPAERESRSNFNLKRHYGITFEEKQAMFEAQGRRCAICRGIDTSKRPWHVDHCHVTKKVRGILCGHCNIMIGRARDSREVLIRAAAYLEEHS